MVSLQAALSQKERRRCPTNRPGDSSSSKKRKWEDGDERDHLKAALPKELKLWKDDDDAPKLVIPPPAAAGASCIDLHLDTPLPPEWQRCLDIQSGKIHFYNTRTHKRTSRDPRESADEEAPPLTDARPVRLDLELNFMCEWSPRSHSGRGGEEEKPEKRHEDGAGDMATAAFSYDHWGHPSSTLCETPSWVSLDADPGEMVATVCGRCHMLVMMCKSSPSCPNCKFLHPPDQISSPAPLKAGVQAIVL